MHPLPFSGPPIHATIFWTTYIIWIIPEIIASRRRPAASSFTLKDRNSYLVVMSMLWLGIAADFALSFTFPQAAIQSGRVTFFFIGIGVMYAGMALRLYSMSVLGRYFTYQVAVHTDQPVIETGPYRYIRHPSYTGGLITLAGLGLALGNWAGMFVLLAFMAAGYAYRIPIEESALAASIGEPYKAYIRRTYRLVPYIY
ncbi:MAG: isoprenylcysteine carboxylmethyltransferase family protein [Candidatus Acidiferrales bacterium]